MVTSAFITTGTQIRQPYPLTKLGLLKPSKNPLPALKDPPQRPGGTGGPVGRRSGVCPEPRTEPSGRSRASERRAQGSGAGRHRRRTAPAAHSFVRLSPLLSPPKARGASPPRVTAFPQGASCPPLPPSGLPLAPDSQGTEAPPSRRRAPRPAAPAPPPPQPRSHRPPEAAAARPGQRRAPGGLSPADFKRFSHRRQPLAGRRPRLPAALLRARPRAGAVPPAVRRSSAPAPGRRRAPRRGRALTHAGSAPGRTKFPARPRGASGEGGAAAGPAPPEPGRCGRADGRTIRRALPQLSGNRGRGRAGATAPRRRPPPPPAAAAPKQPPFPAAACRCRYCCRRARAQPAAGGAGRRRLGASAPRAAGRARVRDRVLPLPAGAGRGGGGDSRRGRRAGAWPARAGAGGRSPSPCQHAGHGAPALARARLFLSCAVFASPAGLGARPSGGGTRGPGRGKGQRRPPRLRARRGPGWGGWGEVCGWVGGCCPGPLPDGGGWPRSRPSGARRISTRRRRKC